MQLKKEYKEAIIKIILEQDLLPVGYVDEMCDDAILEHIVRVSCGLGMSPMEQLLSNIYKGIKK